MTTSSTPCYETGSPSIPPCRRPSLGQSSLTANAADRILALIDGNTEAAWIAARNEVSFVAIVQVVVLHNTAGPWTVDRDGFSLGIGVRCACFDRDAGSNGHDFGESASDLDAGRYSEGIRLGF